MKHNRSPESHARRVNGQQKIRRYCTCGRKFIGNLAWASHMRWAVNHKVDDQHRYNGTKPRDLEES